MHPKPAGPRSCGAAQTLTEIPFYTRYLGPCTLDLRGLAVVGPRETLKEIPLYGVTGAVHLKPAGSRTTLKVNMFVCDPGGRAP